MSKENETDITSDSEFTEVADTRKAKQKALAFLRRAKKADIPSKHIRVNSSQFAELLDLTYIKGNEKSYQEIFGKDYSAKNEQEFADYIYDNADKLLDLNYIIIDGGNSEARRRAGHALLFRLILCDKWGMYKECSGLSHVFQTIITDEDEVPRNVLVNQLKQYGVLFVSEFYPKLMSIHFETGSFFDEFLVARRYSGKPTILSFSEPMTKENKLKNIEYGVTYADLSRQLEPSKHILRIKVVPYESK